MKIDNSRWKLFSFEAVFEVRKGFYNKKPEPSAGGTIPFLGATDSNNGVTEYYTEADLAAASKTGTGDNEPLEEKIFPGHAVCVTNDGSVGYAYYQEQRFTCSHSVNPLYRKDGQFNFLTGLFVATVIMHDRYRWGYGRKWRPERMAKSQLRLPVLCDESGNIVVDDKKKYSPDGYIPDWQWMENYMKTLPCGKITSKIMGCILNDD